MKWEVNTQNSLQVPITMCTVAPGTARNTPAPAFAGLNCPCCGAASGTVLDFMRFLDPHGVERVDREILECTGGTHVFRVRDAELRLVAADGQRIHPARKYGYDGSQLSEVVSS